MNGSAVVAIGVGRCKVGGNNGIMGYLFSVLEKG
jgi:hypothetical protein